MPAYIIAVINVTDPEGYEIYKEMAPPAITKYGGRYLARAGRSEVLEGETDANRFVILEFDSYQKALEFWNSPEYEKAKPHRRRCASATFMLVEGLA